MGKPTGMAREQLRASDLPSAVPGLGRLQLAGGSAIATHSRHRRSIDLGHFSMTTAVDLVAVAEAARVVVDRFEILTSSEVAPRDRAGEVPIDLVGYPCAPLEPPRPGPGGLPLAGLRDLAAMNHEPGFRASWSVMPNSSHLSALSVPVVLAMAVPSLRAPDTDRSRNLLRIPAFRPSSARNPG